MQSNTHLAWACCIQCQAGADFWGLEPAYTSSSFCGTPVECANRWAGICCLRVLSCSLYSEVVLNHVVLFSCSCWQVGMSQDV